MTQSARALGLRPYPFGVRCRAKRWLKYRLCPDCWRLFSSRKLKCEKLLLHVDARGFKKPTGTPWQGLQHKMGMATVQHSNPDMWGPLDEYNERVHSRKLTDDEHQRTIVQTLQDLHDMLKDYHPPKVAHPSMESPKPSPLSFLGSIFRPKPKRKRTQLPGNLPKGLYMFGDVGSGKTMLMDMFYDTLPHNITSKTRIHFHNFMQDVHKRLHAMKMEHGTDLDVVQYVAADIAEKGSVLCFDEFQCTDVADAMILRGCVSPYRGSAVQS